MAGASGRPTLRYPRGMSDPERCPRCAARRIEGVDTCPRCQWRFTETATPPPGPTPSRPEPIRVQNEAMDRRALARMSANAMQVRCLGTAGGCLGSILGAILGFYISTIVTQNALIGVVGALVGFAGGAWLGFFLALRLLAR